MDAPVEAASPEVGQVLYQSAQIPDPRSARDVLAFVLCPIEAFAPAGDAEELAAVAELVQPVKIAALRRWYASHTGSARS
jgi:hypothetical protein